MHRIPTLSLLLLAFVVACGPSPRRIVLGNGTPGPQGNGTVGSPNPNVTVTNGSASNMNPVQRLNAANGHLEARGFQRVGSAVHNRNLAAGQLVAYALNGQPGQCYVAMALGANGTDINMTIVDPRGQPVGHNVLPDANPWVRLCTSEAGRYIVRVQMARGQGEHYFAYYQGSQDPQLASILGGAAPTQNANQPLRPDSATAQRLEAINQRLTGQRYHRVGEVVGYHFPNGESHTIGLQLTEGQCYAFASVGGQGARDTDIAVLGASGDTLVNDRATALDAVVEYCPSSTGRFQLQPTMYDGEGPIFIAGWARTEAGATQATNTTVIDTSSQTAGLGEAFALTNADILARGYETYGDNSEGNLSEGESRDFPLSLEGGKCYAIVAQGAGSVRDLDLVLKNQRGREVDRDVAVSPRPIVRVCPEDSGQFTMSVNMAQGGGDFRYQAYRWPRGTRGPFGLNGLIYVRLGEVSSLLRQEGYEPSSNTPPGRGTLRRQGRTANHDLELPATCVSVLVVGGDGVHDLDISLNQGNRRVAGDDSRSAFPNVRFCPSSPGTYRLNVEAASGNGDYYYQIFER